MPRFLPFGLSLFLVSASFAQGASRAQDPNAIHEFSNPDLSSALYLTVGAADKELKRTPKLMLQLGMTLRQVTDPVLYEHLPFDVTSGLVVENLLARLPANAAGIGWRDLITKVDGQDIVSTDDFIHAYEYCKSDKVPLVIIQKGKLKQVVLDKAAVENTKQYRIGVFVDAVPPKLATHLGLDDETGLYVTELIDEFPAQKAGIEQGDVILAINEKPINSVGELNAVIQSVREQPASVYVLHEGKKKKLLVTPIEDMDALRAERANLISPQIAWLPMRATGGEDQSTSAQLIEISKTLAEMQKEIAQLRDELKK